MIYKLQNCIKNYEWGSPVWIPALLKQANPDKVPQAELWMGCHPAGPSQALVGDTLVPLSDLLRKEATRALPYLFKVLAAAKPLSIQAHPNLEQAQAGFEAENNALIPIDDPQRNYKDANHKPELLCALGPFTAMAGFRAASEIVKRLEAIASLLPNVLKTHCTMLLVILKAAAPQPQVLERFFTAVLNLSAALSGEERILLGQTIMQNEAALIQAFPEYRRDWTSCAQLAAYYPDDPSIIAPLYLNCIDLNVGEALFICAGMPHAYIHGFGVELMANSDNVLRGGLTKKHIDREALSKVLDFKPCNPRVFAAPQTSSARYPSEVQEFSLFMFQSTSEHEETYMFTPEYPSIAIIIEGTALVKYGEGTITLTQGESAYIPASSNPIHISGLFLLYLATTGQQHENLR
ncbi:mannose-6-phosphate isomerase, class I [Breznakiellaceae bacterium SP9]